MYNQRQPSSLIHETNYVKIEIGFLYQQITAFLFLFDVLRISGGKGTDEMNSEMLLKDYANAVKISFTPTVSQGRFMRDVFKAAGYNRFSPSSDEDYAKKICNGSKPITEEMRNGFPKPYHVNELADYYIKNAADNKLWTIANTFGIMDRQLDAELLYTAAAAQHFLRVENVEPIIRNPIRSRRNMAD